MASNKLPPPYQTPSASNRPQIVEKPDGVRLQLPAGFRVEEYAAGFSLPRFMMEGPSGEILVSDSSAGKVWVLSGKDGKADTRKELIAGIKRPYGLALHKGMLYVCEPEAVRRYPYDAKAMTVGPAETIVKLDGYTAGHWTRSIWFDHKKEQFYLGVGSSSDINAGDPEDRATIHRYNADGSGKTIVAKGLRNPVGLQYAPGTTQLWAVVQERDALGDDLVPDYFTAVKPGAFYGWPYAYIGKNEEPRRKGERPDLVAQSTEPDVLLGAHVAALDFTFYSGRTFPAKYRNGAFIAFHGSSNRSQRVGYSIAFVPFKKGKASGPVEPFLTGWMLAPDKREVWGRPVAVLQTRDGNLLVSDDGGKRIWRISYSK
jgi:glucose/arabinose dehydrogenase